MKRRFPRKGLLVALVLLLLAAGSVTFAWLTRDPDDTPVTPPQNSTETTTTSSEEITENTVTDSEASNVTETESNSPSETESIQSETDRSDETQTDTTDSATTDQPTTSTIPMSSVTGTITPPADGSPKRIAFTFDDGPYAPVTRAIADEFAKYGGNCTYFVVGNRIHGDWQEAVRYVASMGNEIAIHAYTHEHYYDRCSNDIYLYELQATADAIYNTVGEIPTLMRPVGGSITTERIANCPYSVIKWNVDTKDWYYKKNTDTIVQNILSNVTDGDIILMHDIYQNTLEAVKIVLPILAEQGYEFVTVSELLGEEIEVGKVYSKTY